MFGGDNKSSRVSECFMRVLGWGPREVFRFYATWHLVVFGTSYVRAWNEIITVYLFCQINDYCFKSYVPLILFASTLPACAPLVADSVTGRN